jgi:hypothetical protein
LAGDRRLRAALSSGMVLLVIQMLDLLPYRLSVLQLIFVVIPRVCDLSSLGERGVEALITCSSIAINALFVVERPPFLALRPLIFTLPQDILIV